VSSDPNKHQNELAAKLTAHQNAKAIEDATIALLTAIKPVGPLPVERPAWHPPRKVPHCPRRARARAGDARENPPAVNERGLFPKDNTRREEHRAEGE
jgi:hypothetical protein